MNIQGLDAMSFTIVYHTDVHKYTFLMMVYAIQMINSAQW